MGRDSKISWCDHTFSMWWGCVKVGGDECCDNCYADTFATRVGFNETPVDPSKFPIWGDDAKRRFFGEKHWNEPLKWERDAVAAGEFHRVFVMSMGDWAEGRPDQAPHLQRFWDLHQRTPHLIKLMLTKRPQLIRKLCPIKNDPLMWHGTTAGTQAWLNLRWAHLRHVESPVLWFSLEPLFERISLPYAYMHMGKQAWVIVGAESGPHARPMDYAWARYVRDQCKEAGIPFHFKQQCDSKGRKLPFEEVPVDLQVREYPECPGLSGDHVAIRPVMISSGTFSIGPDGGEVRG